MHTYSSDVEGPVCVAVLQVGYRLGDRIVRPARVAVAEPEESPQPPAEQPPVDTAVDDATGVETDGDDVEQLDALTPDSNDSNA
jgi:molecular chaperone GrpE